MLKLYLKKLLTMVVYICVFLALYFVVYSALFTLSNFFEAPVLRYLVLFGIPLILIFGVVYHFRAKDGFNRSEYLKNTDRAKLHLKDEFHYLLKFPAFRTELLAFSTFLVPFLFAIGISNENEAPWWANVIAGFLLYLLFAGVYAVIDALLWTSVHRKWRKN